jgi:hypothetical protein
VNGTFDTITQPAGMPSGLEFDVIYNPTLVQLQVVSAALPGDFDLDGDVDGRDFLIWQRNPSVGNLGDWQANYGAGSLSASTAVPEPSAFVLALLGGYSLSRKRLNILRG